MAYEDNPFDEVLSVPASIREDGPPSDVAPEPWAIEYVKQMLAGETLFFPAHNGEKQDWSRHGPFQPLRIAQRAVAPDMKIIFKGRYVNNVPGTAMWMENGAWGEDGATGSAPVAPQATPAEAPSVPF